MKQKKWSKEEEEKLKNIYSNTRNEDIAKIFFVTKGSIDSKAGVMGLKKTKEFRSSMIAKRNKIVGRNLTFELLSEIALRYKTRGEFQKKDSAAYTSARRQGFLEKICGHMTIVQFSIPQLILKKILDLLLNSNSIYNDRRTIKPYEIDVYYPEFKLAFEYQGKGWHGENNKTDLIKKDLFEKEKINIFYIKENSRNYEKDIKNQLIEELFRINKICKTNITEKDVRSCVVGNIYEKLFNKEELLKITKKYNSFKEFTKKEKYVYYKIKKIGILDEATEHMKDRRKKHNIVEIAKTINKYNTLNDLILKDHGVYLHIKRNKLDYLIKNLKDGRRK